jgi:hypothetical protein
MRREAERPCPDVRRSSSALLAIHRQDEPDQDPEDPEDPDELDELDELDEPEAPPEPEESEPLLVVEGALPASLDPLPESLDPPPDSLDPLLAESFELLPPPVLLDEPLRLSVR